MTLIVDILPEAGILETFPARVHVAAARKFLRAYARALSRQPPGAPGRVNKMFTRCADPGGRPIVAGRGFRWLEFETRQTDDVHRV